MSFRLEKSMRIIDEIVGFCCRRGSKDVNINYDINDVNLTIIKVVATDVTITPDDLQLLNNTLSQHRQREMEECYWLITGDDSYGDELSLIGVMIDEYTLNYEHRVLTLTAWRNEK